MAKLRRVTNNINPRLDRISRQMNRVPQDAFKFFVTTTPVRSGNARRKTRRQGNEIHANYPYASRLDEGYSRQAPQGMSKPTFEFIRRRIRQIIGGR